MGGGVGGAGKGSETGRQGCHMNRGPGRKTGRRDTELESIRLGCNYVQTTQQEVGRHVQFTHSPQLGAISLWWLAAYACMHAQHPRACQVLGSCC